MKRLAWGLGVWLVSSAMTVPSASACSCLETPVEEARTASAAVFEAQVASIEPIEGGAGAIRVRLDVVQTWKGANTEHLEVTTSSNEASCGYPFEVGRSYLVYATEAQGELRVSLCSRTRRMEDADSDRAALGTGTIPVDIGEPEDDGHSEGDGQHDEASRPRQELAPRGGGCAGCAVGGGAGAPGALFVLAVLALGIFRRRDR